MEADAPTGGTLFRLAFGVELRPVDQLPREVQNRLDPAWGRFALIRPGTRTRPLLVDGGHAELVEAFREPVTIADVLIGLGRARERDPQDLLEEVFPFLERLIGQRFLVDADSFDVTGETGGLLDSGDQLGDLEIIRSLQRLEDMEVYQVRLGDGRFGALKIRGEATPAAAGRLTHEAGILLAIAGDPGPQVEHEGTYEGREALLLEWVSGSDVSIVSEEWRVRGDESARRQLLDLAVRILETCARLHALGVVHGDINPHNLLVDPSGHVTLLDFEDAVRIGRGAEGITPRGRAGVSIFFEPEYARAILAGEPPPPASAAGEQYALAALVYELLTGVPYLDFDLRWEALLRQIAEEPPRVFADRGLPVWPEVEPVLLRALAKEPADRYPSVAVMAEALAKARTGGPQARVARTSRGPELEDVIRLTLEKAASDGRWMATAVEPPERANVYEGAAGVALALCRMSRSLDESALLELADLWIRRTTGALDRIAAGEALAAPSPLVGRVGIHLVEAMVAGKLDQRSRREDALQQALQCAEGEVSGVDLYAGKASRLLALTLLLKQAGEGRPVDDERLRNLGARAMNDLWADLRTRPPVAATVGDLGMAHGWAGLLWATLQWCRHAGASVPHEVGNRLRELADQAVPIGRGWMWPWSLPLAESRGPRFTAGWCNGSAGYVFLWTTAASALGDDSFLEQAEGAAWNAWESAQREGTLCCGLVGRAYSLLELHRATGDGIWLDRARDLGDLALREGVFEPTFPEGLFQGELALALLAADLRRPHQAWFPLLGPEPDASGRSIL